MKKLFSFFAVLTVLLFMLACGGSKKEENTQPDNDQTDADIADDGDNESRKQGELYGECYPNKTCNEGLICDEENNICIKDPGNQEKPDGDSDNPQKPDDSDDVEISDKDSDNPQEPDEDSDTDIPVTPDDDSDTDIPVTPDEDSDSEIPEATENHKISGILQAGNAVSNVKAALSECGKTEETASANTDANGKFSFNADISANKTYCVKAGDFASCFKGMSDHVANISEITTAAYLVDKTCENIRKSETRVRNYAKLGTGKWLGELDYSKLSGIKSGLKLLASYLNTTDSKTLSEKIAADIQKTDGYEFYKFFNGFKITSNKKEVRINSSNPDSSDNEVSLNIEGGSTVVAEGFKIEWTALNSTAEAATHKIKSTEPGEYIVRAKLVYAGGDPIMISEDSSTILFLLEKISGTIDVSDMSKDISHYIDNGIYAVIPKNTVITKDGNKVNKLKYKILTTGNGSQISKIDFTPNGTTFTGDALYFVYELGTVFGGDPIMLAAKRSNSDGSIDVLQSAGGDPIMLAAGGDPIMLSAGGAPIMQIARSAGDATSMQSAGGDPIMISAGGDPIMSNAAGDPIMLGTSSSVMISKTGHFSEFLLDSASLPVSLDMLLKNWCQNPFYNGYSPVKFIKKGFEENKPGSSLLPYLDCGTFGDLGSDLYELINKQIGYQRNINLIENLYYVSEFYNRMKAKRESGEVAAVKNGLELRSAIASLYTATTSYNRSSSLSDMFDSSMIPLTYSGVIPEDYSSAAKTAVTGSGADNDRYVSTKKEMMIFANYITTSSKGLDLSGVSSPLTPDQLVCAWFNPDIKPASSCSKVYTLNSDGRVALNGTAVSLEDAENIFAKFFMPFNSRLTEDEKLDLFRTFYLALKYAGTIFSDSNAVQELHKKLLKTAYLVFEGIDNNRNAVSIVDTFDASAHTVQILENGSMETKPYLNKLSSLTDLISLNVATPANVEKVLIKIEGYAYNKKSANSSIYYEPTGNLKEKPIILTPGNLAAGTKALKELIGPNNVDELGNITGKMTVVVNSKISGKSYSTQKTYEFLVNEKAEGVETKPIPSDIQVFLRDSGGNPIPDYANPTIILNPGNKVFYLTDGVVSITGLAPASYTIDAFADGYYAKSAAVNVPENANFGVEIRLDNEISSSAEDATLTVKVNIGTEKHPDKVYISIYDEENLLVDKKTSVFGEGGYSDAVISLISGRYTILATGEEMYNYIESITVYEGDNEKEITIVAKNACGNGIVDSGEECEIIGSSAPELVRCGDIYPTSGKPDNTTSCNKNTCRYDNSVCEKAEFCGDGIIDPHETCDTNSINCSEIPGFQGAKGIAACNSLCTKWITENNCSRTTAACGNPPANIVWNDGTGRFNQIYNGTKWIPESKPASYGLTKDECVFSCRKGYKWNGENCIDDPLSLGNICTGQTGCFDNGSTTECPAYGKAFFGQDSQYADAGFCTQKSLTPNGSTVTDDYTHLEWQKTAPAGTMNWTDANEHCSSLNDSGSTNLLWRLPSPTELLTVVENGSIHSAFTTSGSTFWAATDAGNDGRAWMLDENGEIRNVAKSTGNYVLCVRSVYETPSGDFETAAETVTDKTSSLMWQKQYASSNVWAEALSYCEGISTDGRFDWRLPNRNELASLIDYEKTDGVMSSFPGIAAKKFWTSTTATASADEAWAVDFETGEIESVEKAEQNYILCVRNTGECFGEDCADPCSMEPCKNIRNSNHVCTAADDGTFSCGCKSGFQWNNSRCELETTRYIACDDLPLHAIQNIAVGINQTYDGEEWYPSELYVYNENPSSTECRYKCKTKNENASWEGSYVWNGDNCVGETQPVNCGSVNDLPANAQWHDPGMIVQQWECNDIESDCHWDIETAAEYSATPVNNRCRYKCNEHYTWKNSSCVADEQPATCEELPDNATWWNETVTQTWSVNSWEPSTTGSYSESAVANACVFRCNDGYFWKDSKCVTDFGRICTGQTLCYNNSSSDVIECPALGEDFFGQDAQYSTAVCTPQNFTINENNEGNTVTDNNTGLTWEQLPSATKYTWNNRATHCNELNSSNYGGISTWRVPSPFELLTIADSSRYEPAIKPDFVEDLQGMYLWTSKQFSSDNAFRFSTWSGVIFNAAKSTEYSVLCVSGNELVPPSASDFTTSSDGLTVTDNRTGLIWQKESATKTWPEALSYCENLDYAGFTDWRLPNKNELSSLMDHGKSGAPYSNFPDADPNEYWSSSTYARENYHLHAWFANFSTGKIDVVNKPNNRYVRCVRSYICEEGKLWNGTECVADPCYGDPCRNIQNSTCKITGEGEDDYSCICDTENGYFMNSSNTACVNPCEENSCGAYSTGDCTPTAWNKRICGCESGYFWNGSQCGVHLGRICTGQTKCYNNTEEITCSSFNFYGQDAMYTDKCMVQSFTVGTGAQVGTVFDNNTGLVWEQSPSSGFYTWDDAPNHCAELNSSNFGGKNNWRVPNPSELLTIVDISKYWPATNSYFLNMLISNNPSTLWTSKEHKDDTRAAHFFFAHSGSYGFLEKTYSSRVLCVSGDEMQPATSADFTSKTRNGKVVVTDSKTGLMWQKEYETNKTWQQALKYCEDSDYAGYYDWRLPNRNELFSLLNYEKSGFPSSYFPDKPVGLWSSSSRSNQADTAYSEDSDAGKTAYRTVSCVRNAN